MAKAVGEKGHIIAIEPVERNLKLLKKNIEENSLRNVTIVPKGVWEKKGKLPLYYGKRQDCSVFENVVSSDVTEEIEVDTVDNMLKDLGINSVDFVVIEINGAEIEALKGMKDTLRGRVNLAIAAQYERFGLPSHETVVPMLKEQGFNTIVDEEGKVYASKGTEENVWEWRL